MDELKAPDANNQRTKKLRKLLRDNRQALQAVAIEAYPEIDTLVCDAILNHLKEKQLSKYDGEPAKEPFLAWAGPLVEQRANNQRLKELRKLLRDNRQTLLAIAIEAYPEIDTSVFDVILTHLKEKQLPEYAGEPSKEPFFAWAAPLVTWRGKGMPKIHELYFNAVSEINEAAYAEYPILTPHSQAPRILNAVARSLPLFDDELKESSFLEWVLPLAVQEARRYAFTEAVLAKHEKKIKSAIRAALNNKGVVDASITYDDLYQEVALLIFNMAPELARTGTTETAARFRALARRHVGQHMLARKVRKKVIEQRIFEGCYYLGVETFSEAEVASMHADQLENTTF
jgi:hypothetical protein